MKEKINTHKLLYTLLLTLAFFTGYSQNQGAAQETKKESPAKASIGLEGMIGVATNLNSEVYALNVGGPNFKIKLTPKVAIGVGAFPSLYFSPGKVEPKLGLSPRVDYGKFVVIVPAYYNSHDEIWTWTYGIGYKFH